MDYYLEFITAAQIQELTKKMNLIKYQCSNEKEYFYLQLDMMTELLDCLIAEVNNWPKDLN